MENESEKGLVLMCLLRKCMKENEKATIGYRTRIVSINIGNQTLLNLIMILLTHFTCPAMIGKGTG